MLFLIAVYSFIYGLWGVKGFGLAIAVHCIFEMAAQDNQNGRDTKKD